MERRRRRRRRTRDHGQMATLWKVVLDDPTIKESRWRPL